MEKEFSVAVTGKRVHPDIDSIVFVEFKSGMFELLFNFKHRRISDVHLPGDGVLTYVDKEGIFQLFNFPVSIYNGRETRDYFEYQRQDKEQVCFLFIPKSYFIEKELNPTPEQSLIAAEIEYNAFGDVICQNL